MALTKIPSGVISDDAITADKIASGVVQSELASANYQPTMRNLIINGDFQVWQRGTSFSATGFDYTADRWQTQGQTWTGVRSTDAPSNFQYSLDITAGGGGYGTFAQKIEAVNCKHLVGKTVTLSFYAKNVSGPTNCYVVLKVPGATDNWTTSSNAVSALNISDIGSSWTRHTFTFTNLPSTVADGLLVQIFHAPDGNTAQRRYAGIQLELGDTATPFEHRPYDMEFQRCIRYFRTVGDGMIGRANSATNIYFSHHFETPMREIPAMSLATTTIRWGNFYSYDKTSSGAAVGLPRSSINAVVGWVTGYSGLTTADMMQAWQNNPPGWLYCDAEL